jgi:predicted DCC family thiol-disulfide oxidoreductase YuxK
MSEKPHETQHTMNPEITFLYDGGCPLCLREVAMLRRLDRGRGKLAFDDIAAPGFDAARYGAAQADLMARIHGVLPDGTLVEGVEVFRRAYAAVGFGWLLAPTRWPLVRPLADAAYRWFARNRLRLTGRGEVCDADRCSVHAPGARDPEARDAAAANSS